MPRLLRALALTLLSAHLMGCFPVIPFYRSDSTWEAINLKSGDRMRQNVEKAMDEFPEVGKTTREEILLRLGEPDDRGVSDQVFLYRWRMVTWVEGCQGGGDYRRTYVLHLVFDKEGIVQSCLVDSEGSRGH